jgi:hypothetical protein
MPKNRTNERVVKPHIVDRREAARDVRNAVSRPGTIKNLAAADKGIPKGKKPK